MLIFLEIILYFALLMCVLLPIGAWLDRMEKRHQAYTRAKMIEDFFNRYKK